MAANRRELPPEDVGAVLIADWHGQGDYEPSIEGELSAEALPDGTVSVDLLRQDGAPNPFLHIEFDEISDAEDFYRGLGEAIKQARRPR